MAVGQIVGRIAVKVLPDTSDFRSEAKKKLEAIEKQLKPVKIQAQFDATGLKKDMLETIRALNAEIRGKDSYKIKFRAGISSVGMTQEVRDAVRELKTRAKLADKITFQADVSAPANIVVELDKTSLKKVQKELEHWRDKISPLKVGVAPEMVNGTSSLIAARLKFLTRPRTVEITPVLTPGSVSSIATALAALSGARVLNDMLDGLWERLSRLDKSVPIIGTVAEAVAGLSAWGLTAASNLFALSSALAQIAGAGLALPGIVGGLAIGIGATIAVFKDFNQVIPGVQKRFADLQNQMSKRFWEVAEQPIRNLINSLLPQLAAGLRQTSGELGGFFGKLATSLQGAFNGELAAMFDDLSASIKIASGATDAIARILVNLGSVGAGVLPRLAGWFVDITKKFDKWLNKAANDGRLQGWVDTGISQLKELGRALGNLGGIFAGLAHIATAAGGSTLTMFADTLQAIETTVKSAKFIKVMTGALKAAHDAMSLIADKSGANFEKLMERLGKVATKVFPLMGNTIGTALGAIFGALSQPAVMNGLVSMFEGLNTAVVALAPAMGPVGKALGSLMQIVGALASVMGPVIGKALTILSRAIVQVTPVLLPLIDALGGALLGVVTALAPVVAMLARAFVALIRGSGMDALTGIISAISGPLSSLMGTLVNFIPVLATALGPVITLIGNLASAVLPILIDGFNRVLQAISPLLPYIAQLANFLGPVLVPVLSFLATVLVDSIVTAVQGVVQVITGFIDILTGLWDIVAGIFTGDWSRVWDGVKQVVSGAISLITGLIKVWFTVGILGVARKGFAVFKGIFKAGWNGIKTLATEFVSSVKGRLVKFWGDLKTSGTNGMKALWNLIKGIWGDIKAVFSLAWQAIKGSVTSGFNTVKNVISNIGEGIKSIFTKLWDFLKNRVIKGWVNIAKATGSGVAKVFKFVKEMPGKIKGFFGDALNILHDVGAKIIEGFINGITSKFGAVKDKLGSLTKKLTSWKGPEPKDKKLLVPAGKYIIDGLIKGMQSKFDGVKKILGDLTDLIPKHFLKVPDAVEKAMSQVFRSKGKKGLLDFTQDLYKVVDKYKGKIKDAVKAYNDHLDKLDAAKDRLRDLKDEAKSYAESVRDAVLATGNLTQFSALTTKVTDDITAIGKDDAGNTTFAAITKGLSDAVAQASEFKDKIAQLTAAGLNKDALTQLIEAGPEAGLATAKAILDAGAAGVQTINDLQAQLKSAAQLNDPYSAIASGLSDAIGQASQFKTVLAQLVAAGLNPASIKELVDAGPEAGLATAQALLSAGQAGIEQINALQAQLAEQAGGIADLAAQSAYADGINIAEGIVKGLQDTTPKLKGAIESLAEELIKALKKKLKIHSPSRVMQRMGGYVGEGFLKGIESTRSDIKRSIESLGSASPDLSTRLSAFATGGDGGGTVSNRTLIYNAAPGTSLSSEEDLFDAIDRGRNTYF